MKSLTHIGGALIVGILLILGAFSVAQSRQIDSESSVVAVSTTLRDSIEVQDFNNNGIADWKEELNDGGFETIQTPPLKDELETKEEYELPTTLTGGFSVAFIKDYLDGKMRGESFEDPEAFIDTAIDAIERNTQSKKHSRLEFTIIETNSISLYDYGNELVGVFLAHSYEGRDVLVITQDALTNNDPEILRELIPFQNAYDEVIKDMLKMNVPSELAELHTELLNRNEEVSANFLAIQQIFDDPLYTLAHIRKYEETLSSIAMAIKTMVGILTKNNVSYTNSEPGSLLYLFDI